MLRMILHLNKNDLQENRLEEIVKFL